MKLKDTKKEWDKLGTIDPLWAVLTEKDKQGNLWKEKEFFQTGMEEINNSLYFLKKLKIKTKLNKALDFGCGVGRLTQALATKFKKVVGIDIAGSMIKKANQLNKFPKICEYLVNSKDDLSIFKDSEFDFIYTSIVLQHMEPKYTFKYLVEFSRILRLKGILIFELPSQRRSIVNSIAINLAPKFLLTIYRRLTRPYGLIMEMHPIKKEKVINFLKKNKFKILGISKTKASGQNYLSYVYFCQRQNPITSTKPPQNNPIKK